MNTEYIVIRKITDPHSAGYGELRSSPFSFDEGYRPVEAAGVKIEVGELSHDDASQLSKERGVLAVAPSVPIQLIKPMDVGAAAAVPAGPLWGLAAVKADTSSYTGKDVVVAVLDTGIDPTHQAFTDPNLTIVRNNFTKDVDNDVHGHGTHCAGTIFGRNVGGVRIGVAPGITKALIGKVLSGTGGTSGAVVQAMNWAYDNGADVISMSLGFDFPGMVEQLINQGMPAKLAASKALQNYRLTVKTFETVAASLRARSAMEQRPLAIVAAAGNDSLADINPEFKIEVAPPAVSEGFMSVAALRVGPNGWNIAPFSNAGAFISGPGVDIVSAKMGSPGDLVSMSGTSMATPHVAGVTALWADKLKRDGTFSQIYLSARISTSATYAGIASPYSNYDVGLGMITAPSKSRNRDFQLNFPSLNMSAASELSGQPSAGSPDEMPEWAIFFYLAGDLDNLRGKAIEENLRQILSAGSSDQVKIAVQYDSRDSCYRYEVPVWKSAAPRILIREADGVYTITDEEKLEPAEKLRRINSGSQTELESFLNWALPLFPAKRNALVLTGRSKLDRTNGDSKIPITFTICRDDSTRDHLGFVDFSRAIKNALQHNKPDALDILAIDSSHSQFLELAYELEGSVKVLIAPQSDIPDEGWNYLKVIEAWKEVTEETAKNPDTSSSGNRQGSACDGICLAHARRLVEEILNSYRSRGSKPEPGTNSSTPKQEQVDSTGAADGFSVSALDLGKLGGLALAFDSLCMSLMQEMGEGTIWEVRRVIHEFFHPKITDPLAYDNIHYDCGQFFKAWRDALKIKSFLVGVDWLGWTLRNDPLLQKSRRFFSKVRQSLTQDYPQDPWTGILNQALKPPSPAKEPTSQADSDQNWGTKLTDMVDDEIRRGISGTIPQSAYSSMRTSRDNLVGVLKSHISLLARERSKSLHHTIELCSYIDGICSQASDLCKLFEKPDEQKSQKPLDKPGDFVICHRTSGPSNWTGASLYRPNNLDELMNFEYQKFAFHRKIHWSALLGAINLIEMHPLAMWRLISALLTTGSAQTRRDLLNRLSGPNSVIWGLRGQFRVMAPAPMFLLSMERRSSDPIIDEGVEDKPAPEAAAPGPPPSQPQGQRWNNPSQYLVRLECSSQSPIIPEQISKVHPKMMKNFFRELEVFLQSPPGLRNIDTLDALGGVIGDDILQSLGRTLLTERSATLAKTPDAMIHLQLQVPRELMAIPWETMSIKGKRISDLFAIGRRVYMDNALIQSPPRRDKGKIRPLIIAPLYRDGSLPASQKEGEEVMTMFMNLKNKLETAIEFDPRRDTRIGVPINCTEFRQLLRSGKYDILHFAGHGSFHPTNPDESSWLFSDGPLGAREIRNTLCEHSDPPWLVYANACGASAEVLGDGKYQGSQYGLASSFINHGSSAYVGPLWKIEDDLAKAMALEFYAQLLEKRATLGESLAAAKKVPEAQAGAEGNPIGWAGMVLYGDPTGEILQALAGGYDPA